MGLVSRMAPAIGRNPAAPLLDLYSTFPILREVEIRIADAYNKKYETREQDYTLFNIQNTLYTPVHTEGLGDTKVGDLET